MRILLAFIAAIGIVAAAAYSQFGSSALDGVWHGRHRSAPPRDPYLVLLDADENGELSADEVDGAVAILKGLDENADGVLTREELPRPPRPERGRRGDPNREGRPPRGERPAPELEGPDDVAGEVADGRVVFRGGYETDSRDSGRPVALIAAALGVEPQVFRDAFSNVQPSSFGPPSALRARANKKVLMDALAKHGVTNERLDEVSNYYRYRPGDGEVWQSTPARAEAIIEDGEVTGIQIVEAGAGYTSLPKISVAGYGDVKVTAKIEFSKDIRANGRITSLSIVN